MDIVRSFSTRATQKKLLLISTNYFNKWVETEAYTTIKDKDVTKFIWKWEKSRKRMKMELTWSVKDNVDGEKGKNATNDEPMLSKVKRWKVHKEEKKTHRQNEWPKRINEKREFVGCIWNVSVRKID